MALHKGLLVSGAAALTLIHSAPSRAEEVGTGLEEIVVTAQKREQRLMDVPLSVSALTQSDIAARGVQSLQDMQYAVPGLLVSEIGAGQERIQLRGVGALFGLPTVGRYLDEMPINADAQGQGLDLRLIDMERVEVLRGPQPTLYGEGSMGGTVRYLTAAPKLDSFSARATGEWGTVADGDNSYRAEGMLNLPLVQDQLALRLSGGVERDGGWIDSLATGEKDVNDIEIATFRGTLLYEPTDSLSISLMAMHQESDQEYASFGGTDRTTTAVVPARNDDRYDLANLVVTYDFGPASLLSSTGFLDRKGTTGFDVTPFFLPVLNQQLDLPPGYITKLGGLIELDHRMWSQEVRLTSNSDGAFKYAVGYTYRDYGTDNLSVSSSEPGALPFVLIGAVNDDSSISQAVFAELSYAATPRLELLVGGRYFEDKRRQDRITTAFGVTSVDLNEDTFSTFNPRVNIAYKISDAALVYFNAAKGFRSGGFNAQSAGLGIYPIPPTFAPDKLWSYEIGTKQQWLERRLIAELAVYYNDWQDVQALSFAPGSPVPVTTNGGEASGMGADLTLSMQATDDLKASVTVGYSDIEYKTNTLDRFRGDPLDFVSPLTYSAALDYRRPLAGDMTLIAHLDYQHADPYQVTTRNFGNLTNRSDTRDVVNARIGAEVGRVQGYLFVENLSDESDIVFPISGQLFEPIVSRPRVVGVSFTANF